MIQNIQIYDNIFSYAYRSKLYKDIIARDYNIGWADTNIIEHRDKVFMYSSWDIPDFLKSDFYDFIAQFAKNRLFSKTGQVCANTYF